MYVCIYAGLSVCIYMYVCVCVLYTCMHDIVCKFRKNVSVYMYVCVPVYICVYVRSCILYIYFGHRLLSLKFIFELV